MYGTEGLRNCCAPSSPVCLAPITPKATNTMHVTCCGLPGACNRPRITPGSSANAKLHAQKKADRLTSLSNRSYTTPWLHLTLCLAHTLAVLPGRKLAEILATLNLHTGVQSR